MQIKDGSRYKWQSRGTVWIYARSVCVSVYKNVTYSWHVYIKKGNKKKNTISNNHACCERKGKENKQKKKCQPQAYFPRCSFQEKKPSTWIECVCAHSGGIYTGSVFISVHNEADLQLHGPERLQFSALGEERGALWIAPTVPVESCQLRPWRLTRDFGRRFLPPTLLTPFSASRWKKVADCWQWRRKERSHTIGWRGASNVRCSCVAVSILKNIFTKKFWFHFEIEMLFSKFVFCTLLRAPPLCFSPFSLSTLSLRCPDGPLLVSTAPLYKGSWCSSVSVPDKQPAFLSLVLLSVAFYFFWGSFHGLVS